MVELELVYWGKCCSLHDFSGSDIILSKLVEFTLVHSKIIRQTDDKSKEVISLVERVHFAEAKFDASNHYPIPARSVTIPSVSKVEFTLDELYLIYRLYKLYSLKLYKLYSLNESIYGMTTPVEQWNYNPYKWWVFNDILEI